MSISSTSLQSPIFIHGYGCVSAAGIGADALYRVCSEGGDIPPEVRERQVGEQSITSGVRAVDPAELRAAMPRHPRLRRVSNITKFAVTAAAEALGEKGVERVRQEDFRLGIVVSLINGCVNYSSRFFAEVLEDPSMASPILFPETVFNAPASHVASYLKSDGPTYTLIGDCAAWFSAVSVACGWLASDQVDGCLVLCAEELDWLVTEAYELYAKDLHATEGAAAVYLEKAPSGIELESMLGAFDYTSAEERKQAIRRAWQIAKDESHDLLVDGLTGVERIDQDEKEVIAPWMGARMSPATQVGCGGGVSCGLQTVVALDALRHDYASSLVLASGTNQHAFSARFRKTHS